ncbi:hypothetical protein EJ110_NYTH50740 [Nymphaea thermarum]|nr:hypothetical protein EJ110_NYTH50740 [Nymphaea thermarum]
MYTIIGDVTRSLPHYSPADQQAYTVPEVYASSTERVTDGSGMIMRPSEGRHDMRRESTPVKTIQSEDGDVIDCICIYDQPSLFHPSFMNHESR